MDHSPQFLFVTCQVGAEPALKSEVARRWPAFRFAYSRPGFLTFKIPDQGQLTEDFDPELIFARSYGITLGKVTGSDDAALAEQAWAVTAQRPYARLHVWQRDLRAAGDHGYEPQLSEAAIAARAAFVAAAPAWAQAFAGAAPTAKPGELVLDCLLINPGEWWLGFHRAQRGPSCLQGGYFDVPAPAELISRAYFKIAESLAWAGFPVKRGEEFVELGCAPGGSCQYLLGRGLSVLGVDPAAMHESVLANPSFTHERKRAADVRRREFRKTRWLSADMNVAPEFTLDAVEAIVTHPDVHIEGLLLTLKLLDWSLADKLPNYLGRIVGWGYPQVAARQLQHGRQEICVAALRPKKQKRRGGRQVARRDE